MSRTASAPSGASVWDRLTSLPGGRWTKWLVLAAWVLIFAGAGSLSGKLTGIENNKATSYLPASSESTKVYNRLTSPGASQGGSGVIVLYVREGGLTAADRDKVGRDRERLAGLAPGHQAGPVVPSRDGRAAFVGLTVPQNIQSGPLESLLHEVRAAVGPEQQSGLQVLVTGPAAEVNDFVNGFTNIDTTVLLASVGVVAVLLLLTYRSPVLWLLPLLVVGVAYALAAAIVYLLSSRTGLLVNSESGGILPVLVFGAGTDYALLLIARYREELRRHADRHRAMAAALRRAGPAMLASSSTVALGLLCLLAAELSSNRGLGPVGAIGIACAFLAMTTLLPALLVVLGRWVFWPRVPRFGAAEPGELGLWGRVGLAISRGPRRVWVPSVVVLLLLVVGTSQLRLGLPQSDQLRPVPQSVAGQRLLARHYPAGSSDPAIVIARASARQAVADAAARTRGVASVLPGQPLGANVLIPVVLADQPDSAAAEGTIGRLRDAVHAVPGAGAMVGGNTAIALDTREASIRDWEVVVPLVLAVVLVVLALLLRSLVAPVLLVATVVLSYFAALGGAALLFGWPLGLPGTDYSVPLLGFVFLVALGVDYNIFLMTRVREEVSRLDHKTGVLIALAATGGVITSAGLVLAGTFSVLAVLPLVSLVELGILVAFGVLLDTFVVRTVVVPALVLDLGRRTWWPSRLTRGD
jgi:RND superfamily putative drug exporter